VRPTFFDEQRRHRRATWRLAAASALAVVLMGIPVSIAATPLVYGVLLVIGESVNLVHPLPPLVIERLAAAGALLQHALDWLTGESPGQPPSFTSWVLLASMLILPGILLMMALWLGVRALFRRAGVGGLLLAIGARDPRPGDLEERQLQNVIEEMAVAAGLKPPRVVLLESDAVNAALVGSSDADATVVVSRRLLDDFSRDETQAIVGHLVGSMSNGDLRIAFAMASALGSFGLLIALLDAPFGPRSRECLRGVAHLVLARKDAAPAEADLVRAMLASRLALRDSGELLTGARAAAAAALLLSNAAVKWSLYLFTTVLVGPMLALLWRARRYLADATAVQLTRNPDALHDALAHLTRSAGVVPGGASTSYLFIVGPLGPLRTYGRIGFHPDVDRRLRRLRTQGAAAPGPVASADRSRVQRLVAGVGAAFAWSVFSLGILAGFAAMALVVGVSVLASALMLGAVHTAFALVGLVKTAFVG
jgi:Zn-dependent protease with chaperone function